MTSGGGMGGPPGGYGSAPGGYGGEDEGYPGGLGSGGSGMGMLGGGMGGEPGSGGMGLGAGMGLGSGMGQPGGAGQNGRTSDPTFGDDNKADLQRLQRTDFVLQFVWIPTLDKDRSDTPPDSASDENAEADGTETTEQF